MQVVRRGLGVQRRIEFEQAAVEQAVGLGAVRQRAAVLRELVGFLDVHDFTSEEPELEEIFAN